MPRPDQFRILPHDLEGVDLDATGCARRTPACNVLRIVTVDSEKVVLCGKSAESQKPFGAQRERLGIPIPGQVS